ncbi:MAG: CDP-alcohol phosphatidyltransferase family protein [Candidatus Fimivivens sp.]|nr:CDP-alcohol phosphatidyltransferase family protein [Candidatus Fimivivens sp.]
MFSIKNLANIITITRLICAAALIGLVPFSPLFWALYVYCGVSDFLDGLIARSMMQQSELGAKLDSVADVTFFFAVLFSVVSSSTIPSWVLICAIVIMLIRVLAYMIGYKKYRTFSALHTFANKITGGFLFGAPILYYVFGVSTTAIILCILSTFSSCEELLITVLSKDLDRNRKSIFVR